MDYLAIADGIAARYDAALVTPPTGFPKNIQLATARPPNALPQDLSVIVFGSRGDVVYGAMERRDEPAEFLVNFYYAKHEGDIPRESAALLAWLGVLLARLHGQMKLGLAAIGVMKAIVTSWTIGALVYAGTTYDGITLNVQVWTQEAVTLLP